MTDPVEAMLPTASEFVAAVADHDPEGVSALLTPLSVRELHALAIALATMIEEPGAGHADLTRRAISKAAARFGLATSDVRSGSRKIHILDARHVAIYAAHLCGATYSAIGRELDQDHTTAINACGRVAETPRLRRLAHRIAGELGWDRNIEREAS